MKFSRIFMKNMTLIGALALTTLPCFAQQEMDPTWYNPWPSSSPKLVKISQLKTPSAYEARPAVVVNATQSKPRKAKRTSARVNKVAMKQ